MYNIFSFYKIVSGLEAFVLNKEKNTIKNIILSEDNKIINTIDVKFITCIYDYGNNLNSSQTDAIDKTIKNHLTLIHGPPGTGKTTTAIEIIKWLYFKIAESNEKILVTADSNIAVDRLFSEFTKLKFNAIRIGLNKGNNKNLNSDNPSLCMTLTSVNKGNLNTNNFNEMKQEIKYFSFSTK